MFKINIIYDKTVDNKYFPEAVGCTSIVKKICFVIQSKDRRLKYSFCHKYGVPAYWFIFDHSVKKD